MATVYMPMPPTFAADDGAVKAYGYAYLVWKGLGYDVRITTVDADDLELQSATPTFDILCFPYLDSDISLSTSTEVGKVAKRGWGQVTTFCLNFYHTNTTNFNNAGVNDVVGGSNVYEKAYWGLGGTSGIFSHLTRKYADWDTNTVTPIAGDNWPIVNGVDNIHAWRWLPANSANGSAYYYSMGQKVTGTLPLLIQAAVNNGDIPRPPKKRRIAWDFDDFPAIQNTAADVQRAQTKLAEYGYRATLGVWGSFNPASSTGMAECLNHLDTFFLHDHQISSDTYFFNWDFANADKSTNDTNHRDNITAMNVFGAGMELNAGGYRYSNQNSLGPSGLALNSPDISIANDPAETTAMAGYGLKMWRISNNNGGGTQWNIQALRDSGKMAPQQGVRISRYWVVSSETMNQAVLDDTTFTTNAAEHWKNVFWRGFTYEYTGFATHQTDWYDGVAGGTVGAPGATGWERVVDFVAACPDVYQVITPQRDVPQLASRINRSAL